MLNMEFRFSLEVRANMQFLIEAHVHDTPKVFYKWSLCFARFWGRAPRFETNQCWSESFKGEDPL